jgi:hypothetical protein
MVRLKRAFAGRMSGELSLEDIVEIDCVRSDAFIVFCASTRSVPICRCWLILLSQSGKERIELLSLG